MSVAPGIRVVVKLTLDDTWDAQHMALFGSPENFAENLCEVIKDKQIADATEVVSVEILKDQRF